MSNIDGVASGHLGEMQALVDELSDVLRRSVAVDNARLELLCAGAQRGPIDQMRINAIIERTPPQPPVPWLHSHGITTAIEPVRLPRNEEYDMLPRVCFPIRRDGVLLGYLWLFDDPVVTDAEMATACRTVAALSPLMAGDDAEIRARAADLARLVTATLTRETADAAIAEATARGFLPEPRDLTVHIAGLTPRQRGGHSADLDNRDLELALARRRLGRPFLARCSGDQLVTVSALGSGVDRREFETMLFAAARSAGYAVASSGTGESASITELAETVRHARFAAEFSSSEEFGTRFVRWEDLGSWRLLYGRPLHPDTVTALSTDAEQLVLHGNPEHISTVVAYLDAGRRVDITCRALSIHRATLYYRLNRVRELLGPHALDDGWRATALHVALKLHRHLSASHD